MLAQQLLEGEHYVTISLVPTIIEGIRGHLSTALLDPNTEYVTHMLKVLIEHFNKNFGCGELNTMYDEHMTVAHGNRHKGYRKSHMVACFLDPRTK
jgi:hypothetical protein